MTVRDVARRGATRPWSAAAGVLLVYVALSFLMSSGGSLGADTGAKVATLEVMRERGSWRPEVGYWAAAWDPEATVHGLQQTTVAGDDYVVVTTLPMLVAGHPLYDLGGYRLALLLPMLGGLGSAFGCRALARRLGADVGIGWTVFWVVAVASPLSLYALDFWEHAPGAALMIWGVVLVIDASQDRASWRAPVGAGALFGAAATMRTEGLVVAFVGVGLGCAAVLVGSRSLRRPLRLGSLAVLGFASSWLANTALDRSLLGQSGAATDRTGRAEDLVRGAGFRAGDRLHEGLITVFGTYSSYEWRAVLLGLLALGLLSVAVHRALLGDRGPAFLVAGSATALLAVPMIDGLGWVPGGWIAFPIAAFGIVGLRARGTARWTVVGCLIAYVLTWAFQYLEAALPQWGGRYALAVTLVLGTCGICTLGQRGAAALRVVLVPGAVVTALGIAWMSYRTHEIDGLFDRLVDRPEDVVFARYGVFIREGMAAYDERRWLAAGRDDVDGDLRKAAGITSAAGLRTLGVLDESADAPARIADFELVGVTRYEAAGVALFVHSYAREG